MPREPILPTIDWKGVIGSGETYEAWLKGGESPENCARMKAIRAELTLEPQVEGFLGALPRAVYVVAIAEDWCGDVVRHVPVLQKLEAVAPNLHVRYIARGQYPDVFVRFLTNGGEAIPKFVFLSDAFVECGNWGPMPAAGRELIARGKACGDVGAARQKVAGLYEADANLRVVVEELVHLVGVAASVTP